MPIRDAYAVWTVYETMVKLLSERLSDAKSLTRRLLHCAERRQPQRPPGASSRPAEDVEDGEYDGDDRPPAYSHPPVTYAILAAITAVFLAMWIVGHGNFSTL